MRSWQGVMKITTIKDRTTIKELVDCTELEQMPLPIDEHQSDDTKETKTVNEIYSIDKIEKILKCVKCFKKILQAKSSLAHCDNCGQHTRVVNCIKDVCIKIVIKEGEEESQHLTAFSQTLQSVLPNIIDYEEKDIADKIMELQNIKITYDVQSKIIDKLSLIAPGTLV